MKCWPRTKKSLRDTWVAPQVSPPVRSKPLTQGRKSLLTDQRLVESLIRNDFRAFINKAFHTLCPGQPYVREWFIDAIAWQLERVRRGEIKRLIINLPPRSLKSIAASVAFPAYVLGHDPKRRIICVSYSGELAKKHSNDLRAVIEAPWYKLLFPGTRISPHKNTETEIELTKRGFRYTTSVGGTLTGRGGDIIIIDDPLKPDDAMSESKRSGVNQWFTNTLLSRLDNKRTGAIVVVMQRVHVDDLTGFLLNQSDDWEVLSLPAIATVEQEIPVSAIETYTRRIGDVLSLEREPPAVLEDLKRQLGSYAFAAQYQQTPMPPEGAMIKRNWIKRCPNPPKSRIIVQSWDTASKGGPENDWSVCTTWFVARPRWYLVDVWRGRVDYPSLKKKVIELARKWGARRVLIEDTGTGTSLVQELQRKVSGVIGVKPEGDKVSRMATASAKFEAGQVFFPEQASWLADLEAELFAFPGSRHDDQCDSISQALMDDRQLSWSMVPPETWKRAIDLASIPRPRRRRRY